MLLGFERSEIETKFQPLQIDVSKNLSPNIANLIIP